MEHYSTHVNIKVRLMCANLSAMSPWSLSSGHELTLRRVRRSQCRPRLQQDLHQNRHMNIPDTWIFIETCEVFTVQSQATAGPASKQTHEYSLRRVRLHSAVPGYNRTCIKTDTWIFIQTCKAFTVQSQATTGPASKQTHEYSLRRVRRSQCSPRLEQDLHQNRHMNIPDTWIFIETCEVFTVQSQARAGPASKQTHEYSLRRVSSSQCSPRLEQDLHQTDKWIFNETCFRYISTKVGDNVHFFLYKSYVKFHSKICMHCWNINKCQRDPCFDSPNRKAGII